MKISEIKVGKRFRKNLGDIDSLAASIKDVGLLHPIVVNEKDELICGLRRLEAFKRIGYDDIPVHEVDVRNLIKGERDENVVRKSFAPTEINALYREMEELKRGPKEFVSDSDTNEKRQQRAAKALGVSTDTLSKIHQVCLSEDEKLIAEMDETGNVNRAYKKLKQLLRLKKRHKAAAKCQIPDKRIIVGDFWKHADKIADGSLSLIFTDPPYNRNALKMFPQLAKFASDKLAEGGSLLCYVGQIQLPEALRIFAEQLRYWWTICCLHSGAKMLMREYGIRVGWKAILWFVKGTRHNPTAIVQDVVSGGQEKQEHEWQQAESEAQYWIEHLTSKDDLVCDPFLGSGTTAVAAELLGRSWFGFEIDEVTAESASARLHKIEKQK